MQNRITISMPATVTKQVPYFHQKVESAAAEYTYIYWEGQIYYTHGSPEAIGSHSWKELTNTLNRSLAQRTPDEQLEYLKGLAKLVEDSVAPRRAGKKKPVKRK